MVVAAEARLIVFARAPVAGRVKTRLARDVGEARALAVYRALLERTLAVAARVVGAGRELLVAGDDPAGECAVLAARHGFVLGAQRGDGLGERMANALHDALGEGLRRAVLVGCDCPVLEPADLEAAFERLLSRDAVFMPADDGGYVLVGLSRRLPAVFDGPQWGTEAVMAQTRARLLAQGASWAELRTVWDVDDADDLRRWEAAGA
jgi:hypothetical protein